MKSVAFGIVITAVVSQLHRTGILLLFTLMTLASIPRTIAQNPPCAICGCSYCPAGFTVGNPMGVIPIPAEFASEAQGLTEVSCSLLDLLGTSGTLPAEDCNDELRLLPQFRSICGCPALPAAPTTSAPPPTSPVPPPVPVPAPIAPVPTPIAPVPAPPIPTAPVPVPTAPVPVPTAPVPVPAAPVPVPTAPVPVPTAPVPVPTAPVPVPTAPVPVPTPPVSVPTAPVPAPPISIPAVPPAAPVPAPPVSAPALPVIPAQPVSVPTGPGSVPTVPSVSVTNAPMNPPVSTVPTMPTQPATMGPNVTTTATMAPSGVPVDFPSFVPSGVPVSAEGEKTVPVTAPPVPLPPVPLVGDGTGTSSMAIPTGRSTIWLWFVNGFLLLFTVLC